MKKIYTEEQKIEILQRYWSGEPVERLSTDSGVAKSTIYKWIKSTSNKPKAVNMSDFRILKQRCETLEKMVEILQMSPCTVSATVIAPQTRWKNPISSVTQTMRKKFNRTVAVVFLRIFQISHKI